jgi:hypothetical protein
MVMVIRRRSSKTTSKWWDDWRHEFGPHRIHHRHVDRSQSPGRHGLGGALIDGGLQESLLRGVYQAAIPSLALLQLLIGLGHMRIAWVVLERDWAAALRWGSLSLAASATLVTFLSVLFIDGRQALLQGAVLAIELAIIASVARWHTHFSPGPAPTPVR